MTTFLFANVLVSGINIVGDLAAARPAPAVLLCEGLPQTNARSGSEAGGSGQMGRRTRFILAVSLGVSRLQLAFRPCRKRCRRTATAKTGPSFRRGGIAEIVQRAFVARSTFEPTTGRRWSRGPSQLGGLASLQSAVK